MIHFWYFLALSQVDLVMIKTLAFGSEAESD